MTSFESFERKSVVLRPGTIHYREAGAGPTIVFVHGFLVDGRLWAGTAERLSDRFRCVVPDWPFGSHVEPLRPDADLSAVGMAGLVSDFLAALDLEDVTLVGNDTGGAVCQIVATRHPERLARLVLTNCDTHDNFPPREFKLMPPIARIPGGMTALQLPFRAGPIRRMTFRQFTKRAPADLADSWLEPSFSNAEIRRDVRKFLLGVDTRHTMEAAERLQGFDRPVLLAWAPEDRYFKLSYAQRLAAGIPDARIETIEDSRTFVPVDRPDRLAELIAEFARHEPGVPAAQAT